VSNLYRIGKGSDHLFQERDCTAEDYIFHLNRSDRITDALVSLHWLRVPERIQYKVAVLAYRVLHGSALR